MQSAYVVVFELLACKAWMQLLGALRWLPYHHRVGAVTGRLARGGAAPVSSLLSQVRSPATGEDERVPERLLQDCLLHR